MPKLILNPEVFKDPDEVGQAEYRAIYEVVQSVVEDENETPREEIELAAETILNEFILIANGLLTEIEKHGATIEEKEG